MARDGLLIGGVVLLLLLAFGGLVFALTGDGFSNQKKFSIDIVPEQTLDSVYINSPNYGSLVCPGGRGCVEGVSNIITHHHEHNHHEECHKVKLCLDSQCHIYEEVCKKN